MPSPSQADVSTDSGELTEPESDLPIDEGGDIHIVGAPAVVAWFDEEDGQQTRYLCHSTQDHVTIYVQRDNSSNTAFFQIRANVALKAKRDKTHMFLSISPEHIRSVAVVDGHEHEASSKLGTSAYGLEFNLIKPPSMIVPNGDLTPKQKASGIVMDSVRTLARQTSFVVYLAASTLAKCHLVSLCEATSSGRLRPTPKFLELASLYGGKGGKVVELEPLNIASAKSAPAQVDSPPSYDDLGLGSSPAGPSSHQKPSNKRRRASSSSEHFANSSSHKCMNTDVHVIFNKILDRVDLGFRELSTRVGRMEQRLADLEACVKSQGDKLEGEIRRVDQNSSEQVVDLRDELETGLYDVRKETEDIITARVDDEMYAAQQELREHVQDEMAFVEERVGNRLQESLSNASLSLDINWNER